MKEIKQVITIVKYEIVRHVHRKRFLAIIIILFLTVILPIIVRAALGIPNPESPTDYAISALSDISLLTILTATFFAGDTISSEYDKRTAHVLITNPVRREIIYIGKFLAAVSSSLLIVIFPHIVAIVGMQIIYQQIVDKIFLSLLYTILYVFAVISLSMFISSIMKSSTMSIILTFFLLFMIFPVIQFVLTFSKIEPWFIITYCEQIITLVFNPPEQRIIEYHVNNAVFYQYYPDIGTSILVLIAYLVICLLAGIIIFKIREIKE